MPTDDLKVKDYWLTDFDNRAKIAEGASVVTADTQEYLVRGILTVEEWEGQTFTLPTMEVVAAHSPEEAVEFANNLAVYESDDDIEAEDVAWQMTSIKMLVDVNIEYPHLI